eukprot:3033632-Amphidinium_carterae.1
MAGCWHQYDVIDHANQEGVDAFDAVKWAKFYEIVTECSLQLGPAPPCPDATIASATAVWFHQAVYSPKLLKRSNST